MAKKQINFYLRSKELAKAARSSSFEKYRRKIILTSALVLVCLAAFGALRGAALIRSSKAAELLSWCTEPQNVQDYSESLLRQSESTLYSSQLLALQNSAALRATYPKVNDAVLNGVRAAGGSKVEVTFTSYSADTGVLAFDARSDEVIDIPAYVRALKNTGLFDTVSYNGYAGTDGSYSIDLSCVLAAPEEG